MSILFFDLTLNIMSLTECIITTQFPGSHREQQIYIAVLIWLFQRFHILVTNETHYKPSVSQSR